jgi:general secretion pathway protein D
VEPTIHLDGDVAIKVGLEVSNIVREVSTTGGGLAYQLGTRNAATVLRLRDGETQILAGLISDDERTTANKLPGFGDLPLLGRLFSSNLDNRAKTEIVLLITPRIVRSINRPEHMVAEFYSGTEAAVGVQPLAIGATPPGTLAVSTVPGVAGSAPAPGKPAGAPNPVNVLFAIPAQAGAGKEFTASISLPVHPGAASAQLELVYDAGLLAAGEGNGGRAAVRLTRSDNGPAVAEIRFRVLAKSPAATQLRIENLDVRDAAGNTVPANQPTPHTLSIVQ